MPGKLLDRIGQRTMKSPFPGMDPYLERHWGDIHTSLMVYARNQLNAQLPDDLQARVEEGLAVECDDRAWRTIYPDVQVVEEPPAAPFSQSAAAADAAVAEPCVLWLEGESRTERHLEIVDTHDGGRVITAIEILSAANKVGIDGHAAYVRKQHQYLAAGINLVEIDLIREGEHVLSVPVERIPPAYRAPYLVCVRRGAIPRRAEIYGLALRMPLPNIPIPLRPADRDVVLQLQPLIDACYHDGRYQRIDYRADPAPRFGDDDAHWVDQLLRSQGLR